MSKSTVLIKRLVVGQMQTNCYLLVDSDTKEAFIIDPGDDAAFISDQLTSVEARPIAIIVTHGHFDHVLAALELQLLYNIPFRMHVADNFLIDRMNETAAYFLRRPVVELPPKISSDLKDKEQLAFGEHFVTVVHTPGHTPGSVSFYLKERNMLFVGDTIFSDGAVGRTDFSYADPKQLVSSIKIILSHSGVTTLYSGHGDETTVQKEKNYHTQ